MISPDQQFWFPKLADLRRDLQIKTRRPKLQKLKNAKNATTWKTKTNKNNTKNQKKTSGSNEETICGLTIALNWSITGLVCGFGSTGLAWFTALVYGFRFT